MKKKIRKNFLEIFLLKKNSEKFSSWFFSLKGILKNFRENFAGATFKTGFFLHVSFKEKYK